MQSSSARTRLLFEVARACSANDVRALLAELLDAAGLTRDERVEVLGGALVTEAVRPYWAQGYGAGDAHMRLQCEDPELSDAIEAIAPMLLGRADAREEAQHAIATLEQMLQR